MSDASEHGPASAAGERVTGHAYDGIEEYDNPTPGWWVGVFVMTVVFAGLYFVYYHSQVPDRSVYDRYNAAVSDNARKKLAALGITELVVTQDNMLGWMGRKEFLDYGRGVFMANCVACHGSQGQGLVGPNLTDDYYKNVRVLTDIPRVITSGAANGAMPAWGQRLGSVDVALVGTYVASLRGQNLPGPRGAEGEKIAAWPSPPSTAPATTQK